MNNSKSSFLIILFLSTILLLSINISEINGKNQDTESDILFSSDYPIVFNSVDCKIDIRSLDEILVTEIITLENKHLSSMTQVNLLINQSLSNLKLEDEVGELSFSISNTTGIATINLRSALEINQSSFLRLTYTLDFDLIRIKDWFKPAYFYFQFTSPVTYFTLEHKLTIRLPENSFIHKKLGLDSYTEQATIASTGNRLYISWENYDLEPMSKQQFFVFFDEPLGRKTPIWIFIVFPLVSITLGIGATLWVIRRRQEITLKKMGDVFLTENQQNLLRHLYEKGGKQTQKELVILTGFSKSKISRDLSLLEQKGFVEKQRWGKQYRVYLTDLGRKVIE